MFSYSRTDNSLLSRLSFSWNPAIDKNVREQMTAQIKRKEDRVHISDTGMRLLIDGKKAGENWERVTEGASDNLLQAADKDISKAGKLLKQMHEISVSALDKSLDEATVDHLKSQVAVAKSQDEARMKLQMEMGRLQYELEKAGSDVESIVARKAGLSGESFEQECDIFYNSEEYKMLERAYNRILGGEEWDVAELKIPIVEDDQYFGWLQTGEYAWEKTDNPDAPTVGEILKTKGRSVMDIKAAAVSKNELEKNIKKLTGLRSALKAFVEENGESSQDSSTSEKISKKEISDRFLLKMRMGILCRFSRKSLNIRWKHPVFPKMILSFKRGTRPSATNPFWRCPRRWRR